MNTLPTNRHRPVLWNTWLGRLLILVSWAALASALYILLTLYTGPTAAELSNVMKYELISQCLILGAITMGVGGWALLYALPCYREVAFRRQQESRMIEQMKMVRLSLYALTEEFQSIILKFHACAAAIAPVAQERTALESALAAVELSLDKSRSEVLRLISRASCEQ